MLLKFAMYIAVFPPKSIVYFLLTVLKSADFERIQAGLRYDG